MDENVFLRHCTLPCALLVASIGLSSARAEPQHGPLLDDDLFWSANRRYLVGPGPGDKSTIVFIVGGPRALFQKAWAIPGWSPWNSVSDDGDYLVRCRETPDRQRYRPSEVMMSIHRRGKLILAVRLDQLIFDRTNLLALERGSRWGVCKGFVSPHRFSLETVENRLLEYDVKTGTLASVTDLSSSNPRQNSDAGQSQ